MAPGRLPRAAWRSRACPLVSARSRGGAARESKSGRFTEGIVRPRVRPIPRRCASSSGFTGTSASPFAAIVANRGVPRAGASGSRVPSNVFPNARLRQGVEADPFPFAVGRDRLELLVVQDRDNSVHAIWCDNRTAGYLTIMAYASVRYSHHKHLSHTHCHIVRSSGNAQT